MTQFMLVVVFTAVGIGLFRAPFWLAPLFMMLGYAAGYGYQGEIVLRRLVAFTAVWLRQLFAAPRIVNIQAEWDSVRVRAEKQQISGAFAATVFVE